MLLLSKMHTLTSLSKNIFQHKLLEVQRQVALYLILLGFGTKFNRNDHKINSDFNGGFGMRFNGNGENEICTLSKL